MFGARSAGTAESRGRPTIFSIVLRDGLSPVSRAQNLEGRSPEGRHDSGEDRPERERKGKKHVYEGIS